MILGTGRAWHQLNVVEMVTVKSIDGFMSISEYWSLSSSIERSSDFHRNQQEMIQVSNKALPLSFLWKQNSMSLKMPLGSSALVCESPGNPVQDAFHCQPDASITGICFQQQRSQAEDEQIRARQKGLWRVKSTQSIPPPFFSRNRQNIWTETETQWGTVVARHWTGF